MDRLQVNQQLNANEELVSNNGWFRFLMANDGSFGIARVQTNLEVWAPPAVVGHPGGYVVMQGDGNFAAYAPDGTSYWDTHTAGHPGASVVVLEDDGNLVVYDAANHPLWASNTAQDLLSPTIRYTGGMGYSFNETSESWKELCSGLPCFSGLQWPGYASDIVEDVIDGQPVVIQLWKGSCPKFLGLNAFPGGVGAEIGVYHRIPGHVRPPPPPPLLVVPQYTPKLVSALANLADHDLWWPFPTLGAEIEFTLINPNNNQPFFSAGPEKSYWLAKWMDPASYAKYQVDQGGNTPAQVETYILDYKINGINYPRWSTGRAMPRTTSQPWVSLLLQT
jgi:hypothetical protein